MSTVLFIAGSLAVLLAMAVAGLRFGRGLRRSAGFALALLGIGVVLDPPSRHGLESVDTERETTPSPGGDPTET